MTDQEVGRRDRRGLVRVPTMLCACVALVLAGLAACGGSSSIGGTRDGGNEGGSGSSSGSSGGGSSGSSSGLGGGGGCPATVPSQGGACTPSGISCEYGSDPNPNCNVIATCQGAAGWSLPPGGFECVPGTCPATYGDVPQRKDCMPQGLDCAYAQGQCNCAPTLPVSGPNPVWQCSTPATGCPEPRPRVGSACTMPGLVCDYGACSGGVALECSDGTWREALVPCPQ